MTTYIRTDGHTDASLYTRPYLWEKNIKLQQSSPTISNLYMHNHTNITLKLEIMNVRHTLPLTITFLPFTILHFSTNIKHVRQMIRL